MFIYLLPPNYLSQRLLRLNYAVFRSLSNLDYASRPRLITFLSLNFHIYPKKTLKYNLQNAIPSSYRIIAFPLRRIHKRRHHHLDHNHHLNIDRYPHHHCIRSDRLSNLHLRNLQHVLHRTHRVRRNQCRSPNIQDHQLRTFGYQFLWCRRSKCSSWRCWRDGIVYHGTCCVAVNKFWKLGQSIGCNQLISGKNAGHAAMIIAKLLINRPYIPHILC